VRRAAQRSIRAGRGDRRCSILCGVRITFDPPVIAHQLQLVGLVIIALHAALLPLTFLRWGRSDSVNPLV